ncbi:predicted protein, partial [Nematostella vectensis]
LAGAKLVLQCPSTGVPLPSTSWSLNGEPLEKGGRADLRGTELVIPAVAGVDSGKYQCTASNVIALDSRASDSLKSRDPVIVTIGDKVETLTGTEVSIICPVEGLPPPKVTWAKNGPIASGDKFTIARSTDLVFNSGKASVFDSGRYSCRAVNNLGQDTAYSEFIVNATFTVTIGANVSALRGSSITLTCTAEGLPVPAVVWKKGGATLQQGGRAFTLSSTESADSGRYDCVATNLKGTAMASSAVTIHGTLGDPHLGRKVGGTRTSISCPATGFPNPLIRWSRNGESVVPGGHLKIDGSKLLLTNPQKEDNGVYKCLASNPGGDATATSNMTFIGK